MRNYVFYPGHFADYLGFKGGSYILDSTLGFAQDMYSWEKRRQDFYFQFSFFHFKRRRVLSTGRLS